MIEQGQEWERLPFAHSRCYQAFAAYRDMGAERSLRESARRLNKSLTIVGRWSVRWEWQKRGGAYDAHMERIKLKTQEGERREMGVRQAREGQTLQQSACGDALLRRPFLQWAAGECELE